MILCLLMVLWSVGYRQLRFKLVGRIARFAAATPMLAGMLRRLTAFAPGYLIDGFSVAVGIGLIHLLFSMAAGAQAAQLAIAGAVCASLADVAGTVRRNAQQVASPAGMRVAGIASMKVASPADMRIAGTADMKVAGATDMKVASPVGMKVTGATDMKVAGTTDMQAAEVQAAGTADVR